MFDKSLIEVDPYTIAYSRRKTVSLIIKRDGSLVVRAPRRVSEEEIYDLVRKRQDWIAKHRALAKARQPRPKKFAEGESFLFLGKPYPLLVSQDRRDDMYFADAFYVPMHKAHLAKKLMQDWYKKKAAEYLAGRVKFFSGRMGANFKTINITSAKSRWGSHSASYGSLNFSLRLIMAPPPIVDYVAVHELAHVKHHNHGPQFWKLVEKFFPEHKKARAWLNEHGHSLVF